MANFPPLKKHILYCIDRMAERYELSGPFLDVGCGAGEISLHMARKNWSGKAIDLSEKALERTRTQLKAYSSVWVENQSLFVLEGTFNTIIAMDIIEHLEDDVAALDRISSLLSDRGHLILSVPSNPREWRWDDDVFGHYRRYTATELNEKLNDAGFSVLEIWDFTFPVFWLMRRAYTRLKSLPIRSERGQNKMELTLKSTEANTWEMPLISDLLSKDNAIWRAVSKWQFNSFRHMVNSGHEIIVLAVKN